jgi:ketohexokinase
MANIIGIGIATLDIINTVDGYPDEDGKVRATAQQIRRGGNAANTLVMLARLGHHCTLATNLGHDPDAARVRTDLHRHAIDTAACRTIARGRTPVSYITHNARNGTRTIVHYRELPEYGYDAFMRLDLGACDWLHFEGRNVGAVRHMMGHAKREHPELRCSLEVERPRDEIETLFGLADVILFGRSYVTSLDKNPEAFLMEHHHHLPETDLVCTWGEQGAYAVTRDGDAMQAPAYPPPRIVDTIGAGDTFNAGVIDSLVRGLSLVRAIERGCRLAGAKCGHDGLDFALPAGLGDHRDAAAKSGGPH